MSNELISNKAGPMTSCRPPSTVSSRTNQMRAIVMQGGGRGGRAVALQAATAGRLHVLKLLSCYMCTFTYTCTRNLVVPGLPGPRCPNHTTTWNLSGPCRRACRLAGSATLPASRPWHALQPQSTNPKMLSQSLRARKGVILSSRARRSLGVAGPKPTDVTPHRPPLLPGHKFACVLLTTVATLSQSPTQPVDCAP